MMFHEFQFEIFIVLFQTKRNVNLAFFDFFKWIRLTVQFFKECTFSFSLFHASIY